MIWSSIVRAGALLSLWVAIKDLHDLATREVKPNRIYGSLEAARYLGVHRREVIQLIKDNKLRAKLVNGNYRIPGQSILEYLKQ